MFRRRTLKALACLLLLGVFGLVSSVHAYTPAAWIGPTWKARHEHYKQSITRNSLNRKSVGIYTLASADGHEKRALKVLEDRYAKPEAWPEYLRMVVVESWVRYLAKPEMRKAFETNLKRNTNANDAWLWHRVLPKLNDKESVDNTFALDMYQSERRDIYLRLAALSTLTFENFAACAPLLLESLKGELAKPLNKRKVEELRERELHLAGLTSLARVHKPDLASEEWEAIFELLLGHFDNEDFSEDGKRRIGRQLQHIYKAPQAHLNSFRWRMEHMKATQGKDANEGRTAIQRPSFGGIEADGRRIVYVIDLSDSMLEPVAKPAPITGEGRDKEKAPPETGKDSGDAKDGKESDSGDAKDSKPNKDKPKEPEIDLVNEADLPWDKITNRFDLARETLRLSLNRLANVEGLSFSVVLFNEDARFLKATNGLVALNPTTVARAMAEMDAIQAASLSDDPKRPHGTLSEKYRISKNGGGTNLHGGLRLAFGAKPGGVQLEDSNINTELLSSGCDVVFLLSDGEPSECDFDAVDPTDPGTRHVDDLENPSAIPTSPNTHYRSQFRNGWWIRMDLRRLNLFRQAEVHCVAIGEADIQLLRQLASEGAGRVVALGAASKPPEKK